MTSRGRGHPRWPSWGRRRRGSRALAMAVARALPGRGAGLGRLHAGVPGHGRGHGQAHLTRNEAEVAPPPGRPGRARGRSARWPGSRQQARAVAGRHRRRGAVVLVLVGGHRASTSAPWSTTSRSPASSPRCGPRWRAEVDTTALSTPDWRPSIPVAAGRMEPGNRRRASSGPSRWALGSGRPFSSYGPGLDDPPRPMRDAPGRDPLATTEVVAALASPSPLPRQQVAEGFLDEVDALLALDAPPQPHRRPRPSATGS